MTGPSLHGFRKYKKRQRLLRATKGHEIVESHDRQCTEEEMLSFPD